MIHHLPKLVRTGLLSCVTLGIGLLVATEQLLAGNFIVSPVRVDLVSKSARSPASSLLKLHNPTSETIRLQLNAFTWNQNRDGSIQLQPTQDVILFPTLVTLLPGESRNVRLGVTTPAGELEKTYRIVVEELPPLESTQSRGNGAALTMLVKMTIPVFLQPLNSNPHGEIQGMMAQSGMLQFQLLNTGNAHYVTQEIQVQAINTSGQVLFKQTTQGWYMLAGSNRQYSLTLPDTKCRQVSTLNLIVKTDTDSFQKSLLTPNGVCK